MTAFERYGVVRRVEVDSPECFRRPGELHVEMVEPAWASVTFEGVGGFEQWETTLSVRYGDAPRAGARVRLTVEVQP